MYLVLEYIKGGRRLYSAIRQQQHHNTSPAGDRGERPASPGSVNCSVSVIKPSQSFVRTRRRESSQCPDDEDDPFGSLEYVDADDATLYCVGRSGIEKVSYYFLQVV